MLKLWTCGAMSSYIIVSNNRPFLTEIISYHKWRCDCVVVVVVVCQLTTLMSGMKRYVFSTPFILFHSYFRAPTTVAGAHNSIPYPNPYHVLLHAYDRMEIEDSYGKRI